jgi:hypothetical protein
MLGATIVDAYDTLLIMGLKQEAARAEEFILNKLSFDHVRPVCHLATCRSRVLQDVTVSVFETTIRHLGGLLSAYALTGKPQVFNKVLLASSWYANGQYCFVCLVSGQSH